MSKKYRKFNVFLGLLLFVNICLIVLFVYLLGPVSTKGEDVSFVVSDGDSLSNIASELRKKGVIKSSKFFLGYLILKDSREIYAAKYELNTGMRLSEVVDTLKKGGKNADEFSITFKEGLNMRQIAKVIEENTNNSYDDVIKLASSSKYIDELIKKYWFITADVKNKGIYYGLEGYLFPDSYNFASKNVSVSNIFDVMIENYGKNLDKRKDKIEKSGYSVHQIITMASILELEGLDKSSRKDIAGVFYNRLNSKMPLGSDVTSYYGVKKDMTSDLTLSELNDNNPYNTRIDSMAGKIPVGPICNPSIESIDSAISPSKHEYYYFVADKNGKVYLTKNYETHNKVIADLKNKGLWLEW